MEVRLSNSSRSGPRKARVNFQRLGVLSAGEGDEGPRSYRIGRADSKSAIHRRPPDILDIRNAVSAEHGPVGLEVSKTTSCCSRRRLVKLKK